MAVNSGIFNDYTITPRNLTQYTAFRGAADFSQIGQFNQFESGYQFLSVISIPRFLRLNNKAQDINSNFKHMLEFEFRGLDGLPDLNADTFEITDGVNTQRMINRVTRETSVTISSNYFEKSGGLITKYSEYYLSGIKDPNTQAKTYHGLIADGTLAPGLENEVFTMMYYVTDNTMLRLERAVLLANCQLTKAETSMYNGSRDNISNKEMTIEWNCYPITGLQVDKAASYLLRQITGVIVNKSSGTVLYQGYDSSVKDPVALDTADYKYAILKNQSDSNGKSSGIPDNESLTDALAKA